MRYGKAGGNAIMVGMDHGPIILDNYKYISQNTYLSSCCDHGRES